MKTHLKHADLLHHPQLPKADFTPIRRILGDMAPDLMPGPRGRQRLVQALTQRFGESFRMNSEAQRALHHFEGETTKIRSWLKLKGVQHG